MKTALIFSADKNEMYKQKIKKKSGAGLIYR
jgi:hypothetical protein